MVRLGVLHVVKKRMVVIRPDTVQCNNCGDREDYMTTLGSIQSKDIQDKLKKLQLKLKRKETRQKKKEEKCS